MHESKEIINMLASVAFFIYFFYLVRKGKCNRIPAIWLYGVLLITLSNICTVVEGFLLFNFFNMLEHILFTMACILFFIGALRLKPENNLLL